MTDFIPCTARFEPHPLDGWVAAADRACQINPANSPPVMMGLMGDFAPSKEHLAIVTTKKWGASGVSLTVGFESSTNDELRRKILLHMNAWGSYANVKFVASSVDQQVRIAFGNSGYWSYLGTDILGIPKNEPTLNLQGFTINTPEREFYRVVRHETGHTLGAPHEHARRDIVSRLDPQKTIAYFQQTQGWNEATIRQQILTPLSDNSITGTTEAEETSIMTYSFPGSITKDGKPIAGGTDITPMDGAFMGKMYPKAVQPPVNPPPESGESYRFKKPDVVINGKSYTAEWVLSLNSSATNGQKPEAFNMTQPLNAEVLHADLERLCQEVADVQMAGLSPCEAVRQTRAKIDSINKILVTLAAFVPALKSVPATLEAVLKLGEVLCAQFGSTAGGEVTGNLS